MSNIILGYRQDLDKRGNPIITYSTSTFDALVDLGHKVLPMGEGHTITSFEDLKESGPNTLNLKLFAYDLFIDLDCGRNAEGNLPFHCIEKKAPIPSAARLIDSHGHPSFHKRMAPNYDHVFFAVWNKRDLFEKHPSAHWCPNASDANYFDTTLYSPLNKQFDVGFFGSKGGLARADILKRMCDKNELTYDVRGMGRKGNRWPHTGEAMAKCKILFNASQKHDSPNQRVIESMLMNRPLLTDRDPLDGMSKLFELGEHYLSYTSAPELENHLQWCIEEPVLARNMASRVYKLALQKHQVKHRVQQILEVAGVE